VQRGWAVTTVLAAVLAVAIPAGTSSASWGDHQWVSSSVGTSSFNCGTDTDYTTQSSSRFLSGTLDGSDLDSAASVQGLDVTKTGTAGATVTPADAPPVGDTTATTAAYANPLDVGLVGNSLGIDLTGLQVGLPAGSAGATNQMATASATGTSSAAAGLVDDSGGLLVTDNTPDDALPSPASLQIGDALPAIDGVSGSDIEVGAVGSTAQLNGCDALADEIWGGAPSTAAPASQLGRVVSPRAAVLTSATPTVTRRYGIASLDVQVDSPLVSSLVQSVKGTVSSVSTAVANLSGTNGLLSQAIVANIAGQLTNNLRVGTVSGTAAINGLDLSNTVSLLDQNLTDGTVTVNLSAGTVTVDLAHLLGDDTAGLNDLPPNSQIVLDATLLNGIAARVGALLDAWTTTVTTAISAALQKLTLHLALNVNLNLLTVPLVQLNLVADTGLPALMNGGSTVAVGTTVLGGSLGLLTGVVNSLVSNLVSGLPAVLVSTLNADLFSLTGTVGSTLAGIVAPLVTAIGSVMSSLPSILSIEVNVQSQTGSTTTGTRVSTGSFTETALRIDVLGAALPGGLAHLDFAKTTVGPSAVTLGR
jgi:hypothetical protein